MTQPGSIEFWFDFSSPYAYFASQSIGEVAKRHGRSVVWRPFLLGVLFKATGMTSLSQTPLRGEYAQHDWHRLSRRMNIPFNPPAVHPVSQLPASRAYYWIDKERPELSVPFAERVFEAYFQAGEDTGQIETIAKIASSIGVDAGSMQGILELPEVKAEVRAKTDEAQRRGIFGSPFFVVDGEPFWGHDRLPMLDEWLANGGW